MLQPTRKIDKKTPVTEIVRLDYRTADVFRKYEISYCCGGNWPLELVCENYGLDIEQVLSELDTAMRIIPVSTQLDFEGWDIDFLIDYIINVHHQYLKKALPRLETMLAEFAAEHRDKYPYILELENQFALLSRQLTTILHNEETVLFPYIRQIAHAHADRESYAAILLRTLRKPVEETMDKSRVTVTGHVQTIRVLTRNYTPPEKACPSHIVVLAKFRELDEDLQHHFYLEQSILFPRVTAIEKEVLNTP